MFGFIVSHMKKINVTKSNTINLVQVQRVEKQLPLANLHKMTFILFECQSYCQIHWILCLSVIVKEFMITKSSILEIQNLVVNQNPLSRTLNKIKFYLSTYPAKINGNQNRENPILRSFLSKGKFSKKLLLGTTAGLAFKCQR